MFAVQRPASHALLRAMGELRCTVRELRAGLAVPLDELTRIVAVPGLALASVRGFSFNPERTFPCRSITVLREAFAFALKLRAKHAVVVSHADSANDAEALATGRAQVMAAWLQGETDAWLDQFTDGMSEALRWGDAEEAALLAAAGVDTDSSQPGPVEAFQAFVGITVDGIIGPVTRRKLVERFFAKTRDATRPGEARPADGITSLDTSVESHGAGSHFPLARVRAALEEKRAAGANQQPVTVEPSATGDLPPTEADSGGSDNRVDFFFFQATVEPTPGAADGPEYLEWIKAVELQRVLSVVPNPSANVLFLELWDKSGRFRHKHVKYQLTGPQQLSGLTDSQGRLFHDDVKPGDYTLSVTLEFLDGRHAHAETHTAAAVVQAGGFPAQVRMIGAVPRCEATILRGLLFDTNKAFLVPEALPVLKDIRKIYEANSPSELLVVGHTDTTATPAVNDPLSLERAKATLAFLEDDAAAWLEFYGESMPSERRWGDEENTRMRVAVGNPTLSGEALIEAYMALDDATLAAEALQIKGVAHGCGENFPVAESGSELDGSPENDQEDAFDRRVELFFFEPEFGIFPKPPGENSGKGSTEYPQWRKLAKATELEVRGQLRLDLDYGDISAEGIEYIVEFSDGRVETGTLDVHGGAVVPRHTRSYEVSFPELLDPDWSVEEID